MMAGAMPLASMVRILFILVLAKRRDEFDSHGFHQNGIHLMVDEVIDFKDAAVKDIFRLEECAL